jgi:signal transduction histidine kinase
MRRKIVLGLTLFTVVFLACGVYIANRIRTATEDLDRLLALHQVEILREHYLLQIKRVQSDLFLENTLHPSSEESVAANIREMSTLVDSCFGCHHSGPITDRLATLKQKTEAYRVALDGVLVQRRQSPTSVVGAREAAFQIGEDLSARVREMVDQTSSALQKNTRRAWHDIARTRFVLYALLGTGPLLAALLGFAFISGLTRPIGVLLDSTRRLKRGDLDHRVSGMKDEFHELEVSFNEMASSLKQQMLKMQRTEQLAVAGQLAAGLAHEIKNPLGGIKAAMEVLAEEEEFPEANRGLVRSVLQEVVHVESLLKRFLNFARPAKPQLVALNVNAVVEMTLAFHAMSQSTPPGRPAPIRIQKHLSPVPDTLADPLQVQQVLLNLILNAVDSMPAGGVLDVRTWTDEGGETVNIAVADTGRGISAENAQRLFQPFFTTKPAGTGLGLATSKQLIEQHGGSISVADNPGGGTVFRVQLPLLDTSTATAA